MKDLKILACLAGQIIKNKLTNRRVPLFLSLFITNRCNLRCNYCFVIDEGIDKAILDSQYDKQELFRIIDEFYGLGTRMIFMLGGEPLVHPDIHEIVNYIVDKGIYLHLITNGTLIEKRLEAIKRAHVVCVSLDGIGEVNDVMRGQGCFQRAVRGIKASVAAGIPTRIHAVLTRWNLDKIPALAQLSKELRAPLSISPPNFLGETKLEALRITNEEYKVFWREYLGLAEAGFSIANSVEAIKKCLAWPTDYHRYITRGEKFPDYKPIFCLNGYTYAALSADGIMYNCINTECQGPSIYEMGIKTAWERLLEWRPDCVSCASINCIETAMLLNFRKDILFSGFRLHRKSA
jgi:MoaA/NifB/PqqE/SkfB family radical SAM enzyme